MTVIALSVSGRSYHVVTKLRACEASALRGAARTHVYEVT